MKPVTLPTRHSPTLHAPPPPARPSRPPTVFAESLAMPESQQMNLTEQPSRHLMRLNIDMGGFESRRILERMVAEEKNDLLRV